MTITTKRAASLTRQIAAEENHPDPIPPASPKQSTVYAGELAGLQPLAARKMPAEIVSQSASFLGVVHSAPFQGYTDGRLNFAGKDIGRSERNLRLNHPRNFPESAADGSSQEKCATSKQLSLSPIALMVEPASTMGKMAGLNKHAPLPYPLLEINQTALDIQWKCFLNRRDDPAVLQMQLSTALTPLLDKISDSQLLDKAKQLVKQRLSEKQFTVDQETAIFYARGTTATGPIYRCPIYLADGYTTHEDDFFLVPEKADRKMQDNVLRRTGVVLGKNNVVGKGGAAVIKVAMRLTETGSEIVAAKCFRRSIVSGVPENSIYDAIAPENNGMLIKKGYQKNILFLEFASGGDCKKLEGQIRTSSKLTALEKTDLIAALARRYAKPIDNLHNNNRYKTETGRTRPSIAHQDIKSNNYFVVKRNGVYYVVSGDLGQATIKSKSAIPGQLCLRPPEGMREDADTKLADIWYLGKAIDNLASIVPSDMSKKLRALAQSMTIDAPEKRASIEAFNERMFEERPLSDVEMSGLIEKLFAEDA